MRNKTWAAAALSAAFMGLGQWYNRQWLKGLLLFAIGIGGAWWIVERLARDVAGMITLGDAPREMVKVGKTYQFVDGDHSIQLLVQGLIALIFVLLLASLYAMNVRDAWATAKLREAGIAPYSFSVTLRRVAERRFPLMILAVPVTAAILLTVMPILFSVLVAFTDYAAPNLPPANLVHWIGFDTFGNLLRMSSWSGTLVSVALWTLLWSVAATLTTYGLGTMVAIMIQQRGVRFKRLWRTFMVVPFAIPSLVSLLVFRNMFNEQFGPINQYLEMIGLGAVPWLNDLLWARITIIGVNLWLGFPLIMILVSGVLTTIPRDLYEAAEVDGASRAYMFRHITLPLLLFATAPILIMQFAFNFNNFNVIFLLTNGNPIQPDLMYAGGTDLLVTWIYKLTLTNSQFNFASVLSIMIFLVIATVSVLYYRNTRSFKEEDLIQ
ncbi:carbohydrate ABC transporter permease [Cohnella sp. GCM10027633]|uniref:carbohydrate ABC transporter permease n=1 Tax=unclassified Cohnella TaxID=2636738 RepID=UPI00363DD8CC